MRATLAILVALVAVVAGALPATSAPGASERVVMALADEGGHPEPVAGDAGGEVLERVTAGTHVLRVPAARAARALERLRADPRVAWAERDGTYEAAAMEPDDPCVVSCYGTSQWALRHVGAPNAWVRTQGRPDVVVAVLDTGVDATHPDLAGKVVVGGVHTATPTARDLNGHGTHVTGTIAAATNNRLGIAAMGWNTRVLAIKVLDDRGQGRGSSVARGIYEAIAARVQVINLSLAGDDTTVVREAVRAAQDAGILVVAAAGNEGAARPDYPASYPGVVGVAATRRDDSLAPFSNRGPTVALAAPGVDVISTVPGGYSIESGTSMAAPHVAGAAALVFAAFPGSTAHQVRARLARAAVEIPGTGSIVQWGRLDVAGALAPPAPGYWMAGADGGVFAFGSARFSGSAAAARPAQPIVGMAASPTGRGYWLLSRDGGVFAFGDAAYVGSAAGTRRDAPVVAIVPSPSGSGYWIAGADGGVLTFGDAPFAGSMGGRRLAHPVVGMAATPTGRGYWLVARDGGVFAFGDARFFGSTGSIRLSKPIVGMAPTSTGDGYWLVAADGGVFAFGDAPFLGSTGAMALRQPVLALRPGPTGNGYWLVAADGGVFAFGDAPFLGSTGALRLQQPITAAAG